MRIGITCPSASLSVGNAAMVKEIATKHYPSAELIFHPQCRMIDGHFAGDDEARLGAFVEFANDPELDAIWFGRGGYGACRIAGDALPLLNDAARAKTYMGYSDQGFLLGALYNAGFEHVFHGPMPGDITRDGGEEAVKRALSWLVDRDESALEGSLKPDVLYAPYNISVLSNMLGTPEMPDLAGHVLMLEETSEYLYSIDRMMHHIAGNMAGISLRGLKQGRVNDILENDRPFGMDMDEVFDHWRKKIGIAEMARADIGHDIGNKVVPFGAVAI